MTFQLSGASGPAPFGPPPGVTGDKLPPAASGNRANFLDALGASRWDPITSPNASEPIEPALGLATITPPPQFWMPPGDLGWDHNRLFMPVISQPSQFTATAACSPQTSRHTACQAH